MDAGGPYLNAALLCEKVLQERDGVLSIIRIIDRFTIMAVSSAGTMPDTLPPGIVNFNVVAVLKSGVYKGTAPIRMVFRSPSNEVLGETTTDVFFEGDDRGVNLVSPQQMQVSEDGLYWIDLLCAGTLLTRIPLRVIYQRVSQGSLRWPPPPPLSS